MRKHRIWLWLSGLALAAAGAAALLAAPAAAAGLDYTYTDVTFYDWKLVTGVSDLQQGNIDYKHVLLGWKENDSSLYLAGTDYSSTWDEWYAVDGSSQRDLTLGVSSFVTSGDLNTPTLNYQGWDKDNNAPVCYIDPSNATSLGARYGIGENRRLTLDLNDRKARKDWSLQYIGDSKVQVFINVSGAVDLRLARKNNYAYCGGAGDTYDYYMYVATPHPYACINSDLTVGKDQTFNIKDNVILAEGVTLRIEEGAMVSVEGQLYNNGKIVNHGTLVLQQGACISPAEATKQGDSGTIECDGGDVVLLGGSRMYFAPGYGRLGMKNRSTLVNCGDIVVGSALRLEGNSHIVNRDSGSMYLGYYLTQNAANFRNLAKSGGEFPNMAGVPYGSSDYYSLEARGLGVYDTSGIENHGTLKNRMPTYIPGSGGVTGGGSYTQKEVDRFSYASGTASVYINGRSYNLYEGSVYTILDPTTGQVTRRYFGIVANADGQGYKLYGKDIESLSLYSSIYLELCHDPELLIAFAAKTGHSELVPDVRITQVEGDGNYYQIHDGKTIRLVREGSTAIRANMRRVSYNGAEFVGYYTDNRADSVFCGKLYAAQLTEGVTSYELYPIDYAKYPYWIEYAFKLAFPDME